VTPADDTPESDAGPPVELVKRPSDDEPGDDVEPGEGGEDVEAADGGDDEPETAEAARRRRVRGWIEWVAVIAGAVVIALIVRTFLFTTFWIPSGSMEPTLMGEGRRDRVVVNRLAYKWGDPARGDIIVFEVPEGEPSIQVDGQEVKDLIKRVIGLPGETVELRDGDVYIDGEKLDEPYLPDGTVTNAADPSRATFVVPEDCVFVMGDNRSASRDARYWQHPCVPEGDIVGKAFIRIWPLSAFGGI
jgi:signal peptidase I